MAPETLNLARRLVKQAHKQIQFPNLSRVNTLTLDASVAGPEPARNWNAMGFRNCVFQRFACLVTSGTTQPTSLSAALSKGATFQCFYLEVPSLLFGQAAEGLARRAHRGRSSGAGEAVRPRPGVGSRVE